MPISQNGQTHSNNTSAICRRIVWVCLTILWNWRLRVNNFAIFTGKHLSWSLFNNVAGFQACNVIKKRLQDRCFPVNIAQFLRTTISKSICERMPFEVSNPLMGKITLVKEKENSIIINGFLLDFPQVSFQFGVSNRWHVPNGFFLLRGSGSHSLWCWVEVF